MRVTASGGMKFGDASGARNCGGDPSRFDCRAAASFGYLKKNGAFDKIHLPRAWFEIESRVRAEAGDSSIVESQFAPRLRASTNRGAMADKIAERDRTGWRFLAQHFNVLRSLGGAPCLQLPSTYRSDDGDRPNKS